LPGVSSASPPDKFEVPFTVRIPDFKNDLAVFVNTSRETYCNAAILQWEANILAWLRGGGQGPFPDDPVFPDGVKPIGGQMKTTQQGARWEHVRGKDIYVELWRLDPPPPDGLVPGACAATDDLMDLFATGRMTFRGASNDKDRSGTRGARQGEVAKALVTAGDGSRFRYKIVAQFNSRCHVPDGAKTTCRFFNATLTEIR
jgi:hypothetical protein